MIGAGVLLYQATGNSAYLYPGAPDRAGGARLLHLGTARQRKPVLRVRLLPQPALPRLRHPRPAGDDARAGLRQLRLGTPAIRANDVFVFGSPASAQLLVQAAIVQDYALLSTPPTTYF